MRGGVYGDGSKISSRVHCGREDGVMGSLEARGIAEGDWTSFWQAVIVDLFFGGSAWWDSSCPAASLQAGIDAVGTRGDFQRRYGTSIDTIDRQGTWSLTSTVSREMSRNGGYDRYRAALADENAWARARRPKYCKLANNPRLRQAVAVKLRLDWSPEQIAGWLKRTHPEDGCNQVSHETIYRSLFVQTRGVLKKELLGHLRSKRSMRRSKPVEPNGDRRGHIKDIVSIRQRPAAVEDRAVPGHWEGDLLSGPNNSYIATLVERHTRYVMLAKVAGKDTQTVVSALIKQAKKLPKELYKSLTWDRGKELTDHRRFRLATNIDVYFCDPQSPWQRGSNENTNGLLRQYFPKGTDLSVHSQAYLNKVARQLNERPRETLQFETPAERFSACVASTG